MNRRTMRQRNICLILLVLLSLLGGCAKKETRTEAPSEQTVNPVGSGGTRLVLATFNIRHGEYGMDNISNVIREVYPDIIGLEEVDVGCERSGYADEPAEIALLAGYPYRAFAKAISLDEGEYGTALLSRYPIEQFEVIPLDSGNSEPRSVGHAVIDVEGAKLHVLVTHLSHDSRSLVIDQMEEIADMLSTFDNYALLGDLNSYYLEDIRHLNAAYYVNRPDRSYVTYHRWNMAIDNIVVSQSLTELSSGVSETEYSDHNLLYAVFRLNGK